jgi:hypothetical protein
MRKRLGFAVGVIALTFVLSSCWVLQNFSIADYTLTPGQATKVKVTTRPMGPSYKTTGQRQFLIIGIGAVVGGQDGDIAVLNNARWGANGKFGGPIPMAVENGIVSSIAAGDCTASGLDFTDITGVIWKAFATPTNKNDLGKTEVASLMDVSIRAKAAEADVGENYSVMAVVGGWHDDGDGTPEDSASTDDYYSCWGIATGNVYVRAA